MHANKHHLTGSRKEAGRQLAERLSRYAAERDVVVLALPKGGVPVAAEIAGLLNKPFDILIIGKITAPGPKHAHLGAITGGGVRMLNRAMMDHLHLTDSDIHDSLLRESLELARRERFLRGRRPALDVADRTVILVDDGNTPCSTVRDAVRLLRRQHADRVVVAMPAACRHAACDLRLEADEVVTLEETTTRPRAGTWFKKFPPPSSAEVRRLLSAGHG